MLLSKIIKRIIVGVGLAAVVTSSFILGTYAAGNSWKSKVLVKASEDIGKAGYNKAQELLTDIDSVVESRVLEVKNPTIDTKEQEVEEALETYFDGKVQELMQSAEFETLDTEIDGIKDNIISRYIGDIDAAFAGM